MEIRSKGDVKKITNTVLRMKFSPADFFSKYDQIQSFLQILPYLLKISSMENLIVWAVLTMEFL